MVKQVTKINMRVKKVKQLYRLKYMCIFFRVIVINVGMVDGYGMPKCKPSFHLTFIRD